MKKILAPTIIMLISLVLFSNANAYQNQAGTHSPTPTSTSITSSNRDSNTNNSNSTSNSTSTCTTCSPSQNQDQVETQTNTQNQGEESNLSVQVKINLNNEDRNTLQNKIQEKSQELNQYLNQVKENLKTMYEEQIKSQLATHAFLSLGQDETNQNKAMIQSATKLSEQIQNTMQNEEKLALQSKFTKFFVGADRDSISKLNENINQMQLDIDNLKTELNRYDAETQYMYSQYITNLEQELNRLQAKVQTETKSQGIFGWFINLFR